jgi:hypothetical protein
MSYVASIGVIKGFAKTAVEQTMARSNVLDVYLDTGDVARYAVSFGAEIWHSWLTGVSIPPLGKDILTMFPDAICWADFGVGKQKASVFPDHEYHSMSIRVQPSIGDTIELGWDYHRSKAIIHKFAENRTPISWDYPVEGSRDLHLSDLLDSLYPDKRKR